MNKILKTISKYLLLLILFIPCFVKADMGLPERIEYKVRVTNPNGTPALDWEENEIGKIEYDEIINIIFEKIINNELYGGYTENGGMVKLSDTKLVTEKIDLEKIKKDSKLKYYVIDDTNVLYKGPSKIFGKVEPETTLKEGTIIETEYWDDVWAYVEQDGVKGWVYRYNQRIAPYEEIPALAYCYGPNEREITTFNEVKLYNSPKGKEVIGTIPKGTKVEIIYEYGNIYYVSYNEKKGWIEREIIEIKGIEYFNRAIGSSYKVTEIIKKDGVSLYKECNFTSEILETIPYKTKINIKYEFQVINERETWYQIEYNGKIGWVNEYEADGNTIENQPQPDNNINDENQETTTPDTEDTTTTGEEKEKLSPKEIIIICISMALVASLTAFVTIKLINKKKEQQI